MEEKEYIGIDYGMGKTNRDLKNGIHYGVINQNEVLQTWVDSSEAIYDDPSTCETCGGTGEKDNVPCEDCDGEGTVMDDMGEPIGFEYIEDGYIASCGEDGDIFVMKSPFYTLCAYCSPCAPGAGYIMSSRPNGGIRAYCFGHDWFEDGKAPYTVYSVQTEAPVACK